MKKFYILTLAMLVSWNASSQDTFSIIAVDPATGDIGSAGASCVTGVGSSGIIDIITDIIPGRGGVNSQAWVCVPNTNLQNAMMRMEEGMSPQEIIDWLLLNDACSSQGFDPEYRQYGIADFDENGDPRTAGWTGSMTDDYKEDRQGSNFSVQGNILLNQTVIDNMEANFNNTVGTLADKLMAAMQGANFAGADQRCLADGTSSTTAYLLVFKEDDDPNDPWLRINVGQQPPGTEPIDILQDLYDDFLAFEDNEIGKQISIYPNPAGDHLKLQVHNDLELDRVSIYDANGKLVYTRTSEGNNNSDWQIDISSLQSGIYFLKVTSEEGNTSLKFVKD